MWIAQMSDIKALAGIVFWVLESLSAPCLDCLGTALGPCRPGESPMCIAQTISIEALVVLSLAAGEAHITFPAKIARVLYSEPEDDAVGIECFVALMAREEVEILMGLF